MTLFERDGSRAKNTGENKYSYEKCDKFWLDRDIMRVPRVGPVSVIVYGETTLSLHIL